MRRRTGLIASLALLAPVLAGLPPQTAQADPSPGFDPWPRCAAYASAHGLTTVDTDNRDCVVSFQKNTGSGWVDVPPVDHGTPGVHDEPYVDTALGAGTLRFGVYERTVGPGAGIDGNVDPNAHWRFEVNVGSIQPRELYGVTRDTDFSVSGGGAGGNVLLITFQPSPIAWRWPPDDPTQVCEPGNCGDSTTVAGLVYDGFVTGYVTDLEFGEWTAADRVDRNGMINAWNAHYAGTPLYNPSLNSLDIQLANPHLVSAGPPEVVATGYYESFLPNAYLTNVMQVPDPSSLSSGTITVSRVGSSVTVPFTLTHESGGIRIVIHSITFSSPKFRIAPDPTAPGRPRWGSVQRPAPHRVKVVFKPPFADGGPNITAYQARCHRGTAPWSYATAGGSPIVIGGLPSRPVDCQVRAQNRIGWGKWNATRTG